ncbi:hypothetical protein OIU77_004026 [Salix suchowensis]|uniref:ER membrane protein complex subunit 2 n=1 Tax=Salix suchowensis TaxID=1278906 RepID=A0ABQ9AT28_9ROSI|nr:hypothetical protein OIU77_004026 [Salix suchowensis]
MDCQSLDVAKDCVNVLQKKFPESKRVGRLEAMLLEAKGSWGEAEKAYSSLLEDNPFDQVVHKRRVALVKAQGNLSGAIDLLNKYLETFMADHDAWRELAEIYISLQMYKQAAFCYEELILSQPTVPLYHLAYADVLYTLGGIENLLTAKQILFYHHRFDWGEKTPGHFLVFVCVLQLLHSFQKDETRKTRTVQTCNLWRQQLWRKSTSRELLTNSPRSL